MIRQISTEPACGVSVTGIGPRGGSGRGVPRASMRPMTGSSVFVDSSSLRIRSLVLTDARGSSSGFVIQQFCGNELLSLPLSGLVTLNSMTLPPRTVFTSSPSGNGELASLLSRKYLLVTPEKSMTMS